MPPDASVSITTETTTTKTISVEITGAEPPDFSPPPGVEIIEEDAHYTGDVDLNGEVLTNEQKIGLLIPRYRVVYRTIRNRMRGTSFKASGDEPQLGAGKSKRLPLIGNPLVSLKAIEISSTVPDVRRVNTAQTTGPTFILSPMSSPEPVDPELDIQLSDHFQSLRAAEAEKQPNPINERPRPSHLRLLQAILRIRKGQQSQ